MFFIGILYIKHVLWNKAYLTVMAYILRQLFTIILIWSGSGSW